MQKTNGMEPTLDEDTRLSFQLALSALLAERAQFLVAGAFATNHHTGLWRDTKDMDVFCKPSWAGRVLDILARAGFAARVEEQHWLGKATKAGVLVDVIWGSGNWAGPVDDHWFEHARVGHVIGVEVPIASAEDIILSKAWVAGRERYDGADICHLIRSCGRDFDWDDLVSRFGVHWELLLQYLVLYRFVYPDDRNIVPPSLVRELAGRIGTDAEIADGLSFRGPLVDRYAYLHDLRHEGRVDPREEMARRAGLPVADVARRRQLDTAAFDRGIPYRHAALSADEALRAEESAGSAR
jgi:hypothetical protein